MRLTHIITVAIALALGIGTASAAAAGDSGGTPAVRANPDHQQITEQPHPAPPNPAVVANPDERYPASNTPAVIVRTSTPDNGFDWGDAGTGAASARASSPHTLLTALVHEGAPGAVALVRKGDHVHTFAAGLADVKLRRPMRRAFRFRVGSVSKPVVATLVLELVAQRRLRLSDTVARWLPGLIPAGARITVRELLQHRSGLFDYIKEQIPLTLTGQRPLNYVWTPLQLVHIATAHPLDFPPGTRFEYSNTNYDVLGLIVERVTHTGLERYAQRTLFAPLRMTSTSFALGRVHGAHAHGYAPFVPPFRVVPGGLGDTELLNGSSAWADGSLVSTAADLDRFFRALFTGHVIPHRLVALMHAARPAEHGPRPFRYGLGLLQVSLGCGPAWGHDGDIFGYHSVVLASRDAHKLIVLLVNRDFSPPALTAAFRATVRALYCGN